MQNLTDFRKLWKTIGKADNPAKKFKPRTMEYELEKR
jgi:hypothetical protein